MADYNLFVGGNPEDLEDDNEEIDWAQIFQAPENEYGSLGYQSHLMNSSTRDSINERTHSVPKAEGKDEQPEKAVDDSKESNGSRSLTRMELNDHKAGMLGLDKGKINQIIFEASKGSKFYENELKKEKHVAERIAKQTTCVERLTEKQKIEALEITDRMVEELERSRDLKRTFVHIDMDAFYAAVEMLDNPGLRDKPMAVGSNAMLSTSNYPARRYGVRAAMPGFIAKKLCPELVIVPAHYDKYKEYSRQVQEVLAEYDPNFSMASLDEAYLDLTHYLRQKATDGKSAVCKTNSSAELNDVDHGGPDEDPLAVDFGHDAQEVVRELRFRIEQKTRLTASAGIAPNVMLAKVCSDRNKPNGQFFLKPDRESVLEFVHSLPIRKISGIGRVSEQMLKALGIETCKDLYTKRHILYLLHSPISFRFLLGVSLGLGNTSIATDSKRKSMGTESTFSEISEPSKLISMCGRLCQSLAEDLKTETLRAKTVTIKLKTVNFEIKQRSMSPRNPVSTFEEIFSAAKELLKNEISSCLPERLRLRLMGVRLSNFQDSTAGSSKEGKQDTITCFLKRGKPTHLLAQPGCIVENEQFGAEARYFSPSVTQDNTASAFKEELFTCCSTYENDCFTGAVSRSELQHSNLSTEASVVKRVGTPSIFLPENRSEVSENENQNRAPLTCPVCGQEQNVPHGANGMMELNKHIDLCLNKATIREIVSETKAVSTRVASEVTSLPNGKSCQSVSSLAKKRKRQPSGPPSKKVTLHSFWSK